MPTMYIQPKSWEVVDAGGLNEHGNRTFVSTSGLDTHANSIQPDCWVYVSTNGYIAVPSNFTAAAFRVISVRDANGQKLNYQYVSTTNLNIDANVFILEVESLGGLVWRVTEDGLATPISDDATTGWPGKPYVLVLITDPTVVVAPPGNPIGAPPFVTLLDSSTITSTATNASMKIIGVDPEAGNPTYSATPATNSRRVFLAIAYNPAQSQ